MVQRYNNYRILLTGSDGMLGSAFFYDKKNKINIIPTSYKSNSNYEYLDISNSMNVKDVISKYNPDFIINCAAYTNVDLAESNKKHAHNVNVEGLRNIIRFSPKKCKIIHISSDFIFNGIDGPYLETSLPDPINYYGKTKLESENILIGSNRKYIIIRINGLFSFSNHKNFFKWIFNSIHNNKKINVCDDLISNPTFCNDLSDIIMDGIVLDIEGVYNYGSNKFISKYDFAKDIARLLNKDINLITRIKTSDANFIAKRPLNTSLICDKIVNDFDVELSNIYTIINTFNN